MDFMKMLSLRNCIVFTQFLCIFSIHLKKMIENKEKNSFKLPTKYYF